MNSNNAIGIVMMGVFVFLLALVLCTAASEAATTQRFVDMCLSQGGVVRQMDQKMTCAVGANIP